MNKKQQRFVTWFLLEEHSPVPQKYYAIDRVTNKILVMDKHPSLVEEVVKDLNESEEKVTKIIS